MSTVDEARRADGRPRTLLALALGLAVGFPLGRTFPPQEAEATPHPHEYAPIEALDSEAAGAAVLETVRTEFSGTAIGGEPVSVDRLLEEHPLVLLTWFAEWCANCGYEAPVLADLHRRWADRGLAIVARSEYSHPDEVRRFLGEHALHVPVMLGSPNPDPEDEDVVRTSTAHYRLREALGDARKWGTPMTVLLTAGGDSAWVVLGELVPGELERFVETRLGGAGA